MWCACGRHRRPPGRVCVRTDERLQRHRLVRRRRAGQQPQAGQAGRQRGQAEGGGCASQLVGRRAPPERRAPAPAGVHHRAHAREKRPEGSEQRRPGGVGAGGGGPRDAVGAAGGGLAPRLPQVARPQRVVAQHGRGQRAVGARQAGRLRGAQRSAHRRQLRAAQQRQPGRGRLARRGSVHGGKRGRARDGAYPTRARPWEPRPGALGSDARQVDGRAGGEAA